MSRLCRLSKCLLQSDVAIEIVAPVSLEALEPFAFDQAFEAPAHMRSVCSHHHAQLDGVEIFAAKNCRRESAAWPGSVPSSFDRKKRASLFYSIQSPTSVPIPFLVDGRQYGVNGDACRIKVLYVYSEGQIRYR